MNSKLISLTLVTALLGVAGTSVADHNSKNGEGTANMPNDIHNTRVETLESNDNEAFKDFVKYGEGSKTVNRFDSDETQPNKAVEQKGNARAANNQGETKPMNQDRVQAETKSQNNIEARKKSQNRVEKNVNKKGREQIGARKRLQPRASSRLRPNRSAPSARTSSGRKGGGRR